MRRALPLAVLPAAVLLQWAAGAAPAVVERAYARAVYPALAAGVGAVASLVPVSIGEPLLLCAALAVLALLLHAVLRAGRGGRGRLAGFGRLLRAAWLVAGLAYAAFLALWGLNYRREPFAASAALDTRPAAVAELVALCGELVDEANRAREPLRQDPAGVLRLEGDWGDVARRARQGLELASRRYPTLAGRGAAPRRALLSPLLSRLGISGVYLPFTGEPLVNATLPAPELPFSASHELAHQRGYAREDEANYVAAFACRGHPDPGFRYSGALASSRYALVALHAADRGAARRIAGGRSPAVNRDLAALSAWSARYAGPLTRVGERVNDAYLRSQGEAAGVRSYGRMVDLLIAERRERERAAAVLGSAP